MPQRRVADFDGVERIVVALLALNRRLDALFEQLHAVRDPHARPASASSSPGNTSEKLRTRA
jgi:hypothetical protein